MNNKITIHKPIGGVTVSMDIEVDKQSSQHISSAIADGIAKLYKAEAETMENPYINGRVVELVQKIKEANSNKSVPGVPLDKLNEQIEQWESELQRIEKEYGM